VSDPDDLIVVGRDGNLTVAGRSAAARLKRRAGRHLLAVDSAGLLVLRRESPGQDRGPRVLMAGEIVSRMTMLETINVIANASWQGELHVFGAEDAWRLIFFDQGALKWGRSNHPDDRLGEVLYRQGVLSRAQLDDILAQVTPDLRFGQLCVERGILEQEQLFQHLQKQAEQIFYGTLLESSGAFVFTTPDEGAEPPAHTVHVPVQGLLMEGVQRIDEMALFRERIPSSSLCPEVKPGAPEKELDATAQTVLAYCDGTRDIEDIARETGLGEFLTTKSIYHLLGQGQVSLRSSSTVDGEGVRRLVSRFNDVMRDIFMAVATYGGVDQTRQTLSAWIQGSGYAPYFGNEVEEDGSIDVGRVTGSLQDLRHEHPLEALHQALHELVAFALFSATQTLPRDQELSLARDVNRRLKAIRL